MKDVPAEMRATQALLFDLGGVVIDIDFDRAFAQWQSISRLSFAEIKSLFKPDIPYQRHECGEIPSDEYFDHLCTTLKLQRDFRLVADGWNAIYLGEIGETVKIIQATRASIPCYAFTNSNALHQTTWSAQFPAVVQCFDRIFSSHEIGLRKPDRRAFEYIAAAIGVAPRSIIFFDDLVENVDGAAAAGLQAVHVRSPDDVRIALRRIGRAP